MRREGCEGQAAEGVPHLAGLSQKELAAVAAAAGEVDLPGGHDLVHQGTAAHKLGVIVDGAADVTVGGTDGRARSAAATRSARSLR